MDLMVECAGLRVMLGADGPTMVTEPGQSVRLGPLSPGIEIDGEEATPGVVDSVETSGSDGVAVTWRFGEEGISMVQRYGRTGDRGIGLHSLLRNGTPRAIVLNRVNLLGVDLGDGGEIAFARRPENLRLYEQDRYWARVRLPAGGTKEERHSSSSCWLSFDSSEASAFLAGYDTEERWRGEVFTRESQGKIISWSATFDGGDLHAEAGEEIVLESMVFMAGEDPWELLERYADLAARRRGLEIRGPVPVSWCSWYPYRLGVTEERVMSNAKIAARRLKPLGLSIMQVDLGWEDRYMPSSFLENDQFPGGLGRLSGRLAELGLRLGAWIAPFSIHEMDELAAEHPEWLLGGDGSKPLSIGEWYWIPHGRIYVLDLTHPGAQEWLRDRISSLAQRGVRYLKTDFLGMAADHRLKDRHNPKIVAGGGAEASRLGLKIILEEMKRADPSALVLNCSGPEQPGTGAPPLLYTCNDTGNTGYLSWEFHRENYGMNLSGHLFKNRRWGIIQPSCLCVGLPGTLEEARLRATAAFLSGGQIDIGEDLTVLPEDRWEVLLATLPPLGISARPVDLFDPVGGTGLRYDAMARGSTDRGDALEGTLGSRIWHLPVQGGWDGWDLVAFFSYGAPVNAEGRPGITNFQLPLDRIGLDERRKYWVYEFWSEQFLGVLNEGKTAEGYVHPGDAQCLLGRRDGFVDLSFFGPCVKLLVIRKARDHPWVVGTSYHQSGGSELARVEWDGAGLLAGTVKRPAGARGRVIIAPAGWTAVEASVRGHAVELQEGASGALALPVATAEGETEFEVRFSE